MFEEFYDKIRQLKFSQLFIIIIIIESLLSHKINNHISYVTTLKEGIYINYRENQDKNYKTRLCLKIKRLTNVFLSVPWLLRSVLFFSWRYKSYKYKEKFLLERTKVCQVNRPLPKNENR